MSDGAMVPAISSRSRSRQALDKSAAKAWERAISWGEGPGPLPPLKTLDGTTLVRRIGPTKLHEIADRLPDIIDRLADHSTKDRVLLAESFDGAISAHRDAGFRILAGGGASILCLAVPPREERRDPRILIVARYPIMPRWEGKARKCWLQAASGPGSPRWR